MRAEAVSAGEASLLIHPWTLAGEAAAGILAAAFGLTPFAGLLLFFFVFGVLAHVWARLAARGLSLSLSIREDRLFPGQETVLSYSVVNGKLLPLVWLETAHLLPENPPAAPKDAVLETEGAFVPAQEVKRRFSMILWRQTLRWDEPWTALRRGIYRETVVLRTGDGLGLLPKEFSLPREQCRTLAVYPAVVPVQIRLFLRNQWDAQSGAQGYAEDPTVIRATRPYQPSDSVRRINWRLAARQQPLSVNRYETILPKSAHFILDSESFNGFIPHAAELEETLSVLGSVMISLNAAHIACGLSVSQSGEMPARNLFAHMGADTEELLFALASCRLCPLRPITDLDNPSKDRVAPPVFDVQDLFSKAHQIGRFYYAAYDLSSLAGRTLLSRLDPSATTILTAEEPDSRAHGALGAFEVVPLSRLRKGEKA